MIKQYKISVPKSTLNNIYKKVKNYPWKDIQKLNGWTHGTNYKYLKSISKYADILELSFLHNCPIADGGQIQNSTYRSLKNGTTLKDTFQIAKKFKNNNPNKPLRPTVTRFINSNNQIEEIE